MITRPVPYFINGNPGHSTIKHNTISEYDFDMMCEQDLGSRVKG